MMITIPTGFATRSRLQKSMLGGSKIALKKLQNLALASVLRLADAPRLTLATSASKVRRHAILLLIVSRKVVARSSELGEDHAGFYSPQLRALRWLVSVCHARRHVTACAGSKYGQ